MWLVGGRGASSGDGSAADSSWSAWPLVATGNTVLEFDEKPTKAEGLVSGGFFVLEREFLSYLTDEPELLFEQGDEFSVPALLRVADAVDDRVDA